MINEHDIKDMWPGFKEQDPNGKNPHEAGAKLDANKIPLFRGLIDYFPRACMAVAMVSAAGAKKYTWKGWETVPNGVARYTDALTRHLFSEAKGETVDQDTGLLHAAHTAWNALARLELDIREAEKWNKPNGQV
jgi:hypothetical protein